MAEKHRSIRPAAGEIDTWRTAAQAAGIPFNRWVRAACNHRAQLEQALRRQEELEAQEAQERVATSTRAPHRV